MELVTPKVMALNGRAEQQPQQWDHSLLNTNRILKFIIKYFIPFSRLDVLRSAENHSPEFRVRVGMHPVECSVRKLQCIRPPVPPPRHYRWLFCYSSGYFRRCPIYRALWFSWMLFFHENRNVPQIVNNPPFHKCFAYSNMNLTSASHLFRMNISPFRNVL